MPIIEPGKDNALEIPLKFSMTTGALSDGRCRLILTYRDSKGFHRTCQEQIDLPLVSFYRLVPPIKDASKWKFPLHLLIIVCCSVQVCSRNRQASIESKRCV